MHGVAKLDDGAGADANDFYESDYSGHSKDLLAAKRMVVISYAAFAQRFPAGYMLRTAIFANTEKPYLLYFCFAAEAAKEVSA